MNLFKYLKSILVAFVFVSLFAFASSAMAYINPFAIGGAGGSSVTGTEEMGATTYVVGTTIQFWGEMEFNAGNASAPDSTSVNMKVTVAGTSISNATIISPITISAVTNPKYVQGYYSANISTPGSYTAHFTAKAFGITKTYDMPFTVVAGGSGNGMTVSVTASPDKVDQGGTSTIYWTSTGATTCNSYGHGNGLSGSFVTAPLTTSTNYPVMCSAPSYQITDTINLQDNDGHYVNGTETVSGSSFLPGATITLTGFMEASGTPDGFTYVGLRAHIEGTSSNVTIINNTTMLNYRDTPEYESVSGSGTLPEQTAPGN